ncbi:MAG: hypothetical protein ABIP55_01150, partial [Tepidisphaeraceae bacterium]
MRRLIEQEQGGLLDPRVAVRQRRSELLLVPQAVQRDDERVLDKPLFLPRERGDDRWYGCRRPTPDQRFSKS